VATAKGFRLAYVMLIRQAAGVDGISIDQIAAELECSVRHAYKIVTKVELAAPVVRGEDKLYRVVLNGDV
jgi:hypothetical protein